MTGPAIGRLAAWVDCACGAEVEFPDLSPDDLWAQVSIPCEDCGQRVEIVCDVQVQMARPRGESA